MSGQNQFTGPGNTPFISTSQALRDAQNTDLDFAPSQPSPQQDNNPFVGVGGVQQGAPGLTQENPGQNQTLQQAPPSPQAQTAGGQQQAPSPGVSPQAQTGGGQFRGAQDPSEMADPENQRQFQEQVQNDPGLFQQATEKWKGFMDTLANDQNVQQALLSFGAQTLQASSSSSFNEAVGGGVQSGLQTFREGEQQDFQNQLAQGQLANEQEQNRIRSAKLQQELAELGREQRTNTPLVSGDDELGKRLGIPEGESARVEIQRDREGNIANFEVKGRFGSGDDGSTNVSVNTKLPSEAAEDRVKSITDLEGELANRTNATLNLVNTGERIKELVDQEGGAQSVGLPGMLNRVTESTVTQARAIANNTPGLEFNVDNFDFGESANLSRAAKVNALAMAYDIARAEEGGRLSEPDVQNALSRIGVTSGSPDQIITAVDETTTGAVSELQNRSATLSERARGVEGVDSVFNPRKVFEERGLDFDQFTRGNLSSQGGRQQRQGNNRTGQNRPQRNRRSQGSSQGNIPTPQNFDAQAAENISEEQLGTMFEQNRNLTLDDLNPEAVRVLRRRFPDKLGNGSNGGN